jgi:hypothetical protein
MAAARWVLCTVLACAVGEVRAASPQLTGLLACRDLADPAARLACFDREAEALATGAHTAATSAKAPPAMAAAQPPASSAPAAPVASAPPAAPAQLAIASPPLSAEQQFGLPERTVAAKEVAAGTRASDAAKVEAHIATLAAAADGRILFTLDNGQVWRQLQAEGDLLAKPGDLVVVSRALLGSFWLSAPSGRGCKVTRLR